MFTGSQVVAVIHEKGGCGKTTVVVALATTAARTGLSVCVIDIDPQTSAANWGDRYKGENVVVLSPQVGRLKQTVDAALENGADFIIIDTPGKNSSWSIEAAKLADVVLVPTRAEVFDMECLPKVRDMVRSAGDPPAFVLWNEIHPSATKAPIELKAHTPEIAGGLPACPVHLTHQKTHSNMQATGDDLSGTAAAEFADLFLFVRNKMTRRTADGERSPKSA